MFKFSIFDAAYRPAGLWTRTVVGMTRTQVRKVLAEYELGQIFRFDPEAEHLEQDKSVLKQITEEVKKQAAEIASNWGVFVSTVNIDTIEMPEQVQQQMLQMWGAAYAQRKALIEADTEKIVQAAKAKARTETILAISRGIIQLLGKDAKAEDLIALRFIEYLEKAAETGRGENGWSTQQQIDAMRTFQRLGIRPGEEQALERMRE